MDHDQSSQKDSDENSKEISERDAKEEPNTIDVSKNQIQNFKN